MTPERVTVTIRSSTGEEAPLTVQDAMRQILDFFDLLSAAGGEEGKVVSWRLIAVSMTSPLSATAQAFSDAPGILAETVARREKNQLSNLFREITEQGDVPDWMDDATRAKARAFFNRNLNGIGRTDIKFDEEAPLTVIVERSARTAISAFERSERVEAEDDLSRSEIGSVEGNVIRLETYHGQPAIRLQERLHGWQFPCVLSPPLADHIGHQHDWAEVWTGRRVQVSGQILFRAAGHIGRVYATEIKLIDERRLTYADISDPNFTNGLSARDYLNQLWEEDEVG
jgi:hypothetical protein